MTDAARDADRGRLIDVGAVELWVDEVGPAIGDPVVLLAGADTPGFRWAPSFVDRLVAAGHRVIRYDHRDCGRSTPLGSDAGYLLDDLAADLVGLLDRLQIGSAHLIGRSMGGMIAQVVALEHADRVASLTLLSTTPGVDDERLPGPDEHFVNRMMKRLYAGPPDDHAGRVHWLVELAELMAGTAYPLDLEAEVVLADAQLRTGWSPESGHGVAAFGSPSRLERLGEIQQPTLVVHGTADPVLPIEHGQALAFGIDGAVYVEVDQLGHEAPAAFLDELVPSLLHHLASSRHG